MARMFKDMVCGCVLALAFLAAGPGRTQDVSLVLDRGETAVELFVGMPARTAVEAFGLAPDLLEGPDGTVDFVALREGTWGIGDALFAGVKTQIGGKDAAFEGMSLMVHLKDLRLPLETPLDALTAISVCGVEPPAVPPTLDDLYLYAGMIAYTSDPQAALRLDLPRDRQDALQVQLRDYRQGRLIAAQQFALPPGQALTLGGADRWWMWAAGLAGLGALAMTGVWFRRALPAARV
jgi:hypothetical protein